MTCPICKGALWVCENAPTVPFDIDVHDCAGMNCSCNPGGDFPPDILLLASVDPEQQAAIDATNTALTKASKAEPKS